MLELPSKYKSNVHNKFWLEITFEIDFIVLCAAMHAAAWCLEVWWKSNESCQIKICCQFSSKVQMGGKHKTCLFPEDFHLIYFVKVFTNCQTKSMIQGLIHD